MLINHVGLAVRQYTDMKSEDECKEWLWVAILNHNSQDHRRSWLTIKELENKWYHPEMVQEPGPNKYPRVS
jgi:hypothetical protein